MTPADQAKGGDPDGGGLLYGITVYHIALLCGNPFNGGGGYTPGMVGDMTPNQVYMRLADLELLKKPIGKRTRKTPGLKAVTEMRPDTDGKLKGRTGDDKPIKGVVRGKSKAREIMERQAAKRAAELKTAKTTKRGRRRGGR